MNKTMNKKGLVNEIYMVIILFLVAAMIIGGFWIVATVAPIVVGGGQNLMNTVHDSVNANNANTTLSNATNSAYSVGTSILGVVQGITYFILLGLMGGFIAVCYYVRTYKFLAFVWVGIMIALVFLSIIVSNAYQQAYTTSADLAAFYNTWGTSNFLMNYLPEITGTLAVLSGIILFAIISSGDEEETRTL